MCSISADHEGLSEGTSFQVLRDYRIMLAPLRFGAGIKGSSQPPPDTCWGGLMGRRLSLAQHVQAIGRHPSPPSPSLPHAPPAPRPRPTAAAPVPPPILSACENIWSWKSQDLAVCLVYKLLLGALGARRLLAAVHSIPY